VLAGCSPPNAREGETGELVTPVHTIIEIHSYTQATPQIHNIPSLLWLLRQIIEGLVFIIGQLLMVCTGVTSEGHTAAYQYAAHRKFYSHHRGGTWQNCADGEQGYKYLMGKNGFVKVWGYKKVTRNFTTHPVSPCPGVPVVDDTPRSPRTDPVASHRAHLDTTIPPHSL